MCLTILLRRYNLLVLAVKSVAQPVGAIANGTRYTGTPSTK